MNERFRKDADTLLSGLKWSREDAQTVLLNVKGEKPEMKRKLSAALAVALAIVLLAATALGFGMLKSEKYSTVEKARGALTEKYGLTAEMLAMFSAQAGEENGVTVVQFTTNNGTFMDPYLAGSYAVAFDRSGNTCAVWSHDGMEKSSWEDGELRAPAWGAKQLQAVLDRYAYYTNWLEEFSTALPIAEQLEKYAELDEAMAPLQEPATYRTLAVEETDIPEEKAVEIARAAAQEHYGAEIDDAWIVHRELRENETDGRAYDIFFENGRKWLEVYVFTPSGETGFPGEQDEEAAATVDAEALRAAEEILLAQYGLADDMLALFTPRREGNTVTFSPEIKRLDEIADWRWAQELQPKLGEYTVDLDGKTASWTLADQNDGAAHTESNWAQANAYDARILSWVLALLEKTAPITAKYPQDQTDWFSVEDAAAYDGLMRAAGFPSPYLNHALPGANDISQQEAESLAVMAVSGAYDALESDVRGWLTHTEYTLDNGGTWTVWLQGTGSYGMGFVSLEAATGNVLMVQMDSLAVGNG